MSKTSEIQIGDFLEIPAWNAFGMVTEIEPGWYGDDSAVRVKLDLDPDGTLSHWYQIEDGQFTNNLQ